MLDGKQHGDVDEGRCRTQKEAFLAGWEAAKTQRANLSIQTRQEAYRDWKRRQAPRPQV